MNASPHLFGVLSLRGAILPHKEIAVDAAEFVHCFCGLSCHWCLCFFAICFAFGFSDEFTADPHARWLSLRRRFGFEGFELRNRSAARVAGGQVALWQHDSIHGDC